MFYILYEIRNNLNGKIYVGVHKTKKLDDGYMGSGKVICAAIAKYGIENFTKRILEQFETSAAMFAREKEIVTDEFLLREDTYNLRRGGTGGFDYINKNGLDYAGYSSREEKMKTISPMAKQCGDEIRKSALVQLLKHYADPVKSAKSRQQARTTIKEKYGLYNTWHKGSERSATARKKMSIAGSGEKNSQFGSMWITNEQENKKIKKTEPVPEGWRKGRMLP